MIEVDEKSLADLRDTFNRLKAEFGLETITEWEATIREWFRGLIDYTRAMVPLAPKYAEWKAKNGFNTEPLKLTGQTLSEISGTSQRPMEQVRPGLFTMGLSPYPGFRDRKHKTKSPVWVLFSGRPGKQPARQWYDSGVSAKEMASLDTVLNKLIDEKFGRAMQ
jgi:hypothetical protein